MEERPRRARVVVRGRAVPMLPGSVVVALVAGSLGLIAGWRLAGGGAPTTASPATMTPAPLIQAASVDPSLRQAATGLAGTGRWLICRSDGDLSCDSIQPRRSAPAAAAGATGPPWSAGEAVTLATGGRITLAADLSHAVGAFISLVGEDGTTTDPPTTVQGDGVHYADLGVLPAGRYAIVVRAELGPPAGGLLEVVGLTVARATEP